jgi:hypothetical protein
MNKVDWLKRWRNLMLDRRRDVCSFAADNIIDGGGSDI